MVRSDEMKQNKEKSNICKYCPFVSKNKIGIIKRMLFNFGYILILSLISILLYLFWTIFYESSIIALIFKDTLSKNLFWIIVVIFFTLIFILPICLQKILFFEKILLWYKKYLIPFIISEIIVIFGVIYSKWLWLILFIVFIIILSFIEYYADFNWLILFIILSVFLFLNLGVVFISSNYMSNLNYDLNCNNKIVTLKCNSFYQYNQSSFSCNDINKDQNLNFNFFIPLNNTYLDENMILNNDLNCNVKENQIIRGYEEIEQDRKDFTFWILAVFGFCIITIPLLFDTLLNLLEKSKKINK